MKKTNLILALMFGTFMSSSSIAGPVSVPNDQDYLAIALASEQIAQGMTLDTPINGGVEIVKAVKEKYKDADGKDAERVTGYVKTKNTGAGLMRVFDVNGEKFVVLGKRFGKSWKFSVGGAVDADDKTLRDAFAREVTEELFGQLPLSGGLSLLQSDSGQELITAAGGMKVVEKDGVQEILTEGWGPYFTAFGVQTDYTQTDLETAVSILNMNAHLHHTVLEKVFSGYFDDKTGTVRAGVDQAELQGKAQAALDEFAAKESEDGFVPMSDAAKQVLNALVATGSYSFDSAKSYKEFLENVRIYAEYSEFKLLSWEQYVEGSEADALLPKDLQTYFGNEKKARDTFIAEFSKKKA